MKAIRSLFLGKSTEISDLLVGEKLKKAMDRKLND